MKVRSERCLKTYRYFKNENRSSRPHKRDLHLRAYARRGGRGKVQGGGIRLHSYHKPFQYADCLSFEKQGVTDFFRQYHESYLLAKEAGDKAGLLVLNGYEIRFDEADNDYLVYGMSDKTAADYKKLFAMHPRDFSKLSYEQDFLFYQAHPFRNNMKITAPELLFGIEIKNGNPRHDSRNDIAELWAKKYAMRMIAGSDCHRQEDVGATGIITDRTVKDIDSLVCVLKSNDYRII